MDEQPKKEIEITAQWLALFVELLVLKYGVAGLVRLENVPALLDDVPARMLIQGYVLGEDLMIQVLPATEERISLDELDRLEKQIKETVH